MMTFIMLPPTPGAARAHALRRVAHSGMVISLIHSRAVRARVERGAAFELHGQPLADILDADAFLPTGLFSRNGIAHAQGQHFPHGMDGDAHLTGP
jgi:hypothetical protein